MIKNNTKFTLLVSFIFVIVWSTGFIVGRGIIDSVSPNIFLAIRFFLSSLLFTIIAMVLKKKFPPLNVWYKHILAGIFINGIYLCGSYWAISQGLPPSIMALIGSLQPALSMILGLVFMGEKVRPMQIIGILIGLTGVAFVISPSMSQTKELNYSLASLLAAFISILSITLGTILQKTSISKFELIPSLAIQNIAAMFVSAALASILGESKLSLNSDLIFSVSWSVLILSGLGSYLLVFLVRNNGTTKTTSIMFLAPPLAALEAWVIFNEKLINVQVIGFLIALLGVIICRKK